MSTDGATGAGPFRAAYSSALEDYLGDPSEGSQAQQLSKEAEQQASDAEARVKETEQLRAQSKATAKDTARQLERDSADGGLDSYNKPELIDLAAGIGIEKRTTMTKGELVDAIAKASRSTR